jgi:hypothetical protein
VEGNRGQKGVEGGIDGTEGAKEGRRGRGVSTGVCFQVGSERGEAGMYRGLLFHHQAGLT